MNKKITLVDMKKNEIADISLTKDNQLTITVSDKNSDLKEYIGIK